MNCITKYHRCLKQINTVKKMKVIDLKAVSL